MPAVAHDTSAVGFLQADPVLKAAANNSGSHFLKKHKFWAFQKW